MITKHHSLSNAPTTHMTKRVTSRSPTSERHGPNDATTRLDRTHPDAPGGDRGTSIGGWPAANTKNRSIGGTYERPWDTLGGWPATHPHETSDDLGTAGNSPDVVQHPKAKALPEPTAKHPAPATRGRSRSSRSAVKISPVTCQRGALVKGRRPEVRLSRSKVGGKVAQ